MRVDLAALLDRNQVHDGVFTTAVPGLTVMRSTRETLPDYRLLRPSLCLIAQGAKEMTAGDASFVYREGQALVVSVDMPVVGRVVQASRAEPFLGLSLEFDLGAMRDVLEQLSTPPELAAEQPSSLFVSEADSLVTDCVRRLVRLADRRDAISILYGSVMRELYYHLLTGPGAQRIAQLIATSVASKRVVDTIHYIRENFASAIKIEQLADIAHMSSSSFYAQFKEHTSLSPIQFQKQLRLIEARRLLIDRRAAVSQAAFDVGYESVSQFSREYRRMFGRPPMRDALQVSPVTASAA